MNIFEQYNKILFSEDKQIFDKVEQEKDIKILQEREQISLVFANTLRHGYYGIVIDGKLTLIGEEDEGISNNEIKEFFGINQYGKNRDSGIMWIVVVVETYYPSVYHFEKEIDARKAYDDYAESGIVVHLAEVKESNFNEEKFNVDTDINDVKTLNVEW